MRAGASGEKQVLEDESREQGGSRTLGAGNGSSVSSVGSEDPWAGGLQAGRTPSRHHDTQKRNDKGPHAEGAGGRTQSVWERSRKQKRDWAFIFGCSAGPTRYPTCDRCALTLVA